MRLTSTHLQYWLQRQAPLPSWARGLRPHHITIDEIVNLNAGLRLTHETSNTLTLLKRRTGESLQARLRELAHDPGTLIRPARRAGSCAAWLRRLTGERIDTPAFRANRARVSVDRLIDRVFPLS